MYTHNKKTNKQTTLTWLTDLDYRTKIGCGSHVFNPISTNDEYLYRTLRGLVILQRIDCLLFNVQLALFKL